MHPYRMQRLIKERGKDQVINVGQRASLYQTISQLLRAGLIATWETEQQEGFPERTVYKLTEKGHVTAVSWLRDMLSTPAQEFPEFPAAISLLPLLTIEDAIHQMEIRKGKLTEQIAAIDSEAEATVGRLPRLFLLEAEYMRIVLHAELKWVQSIMTDLRTGELTWHHDWLQPLVQPTTEE